MHTGVEIRPYLINSEGLVYRKSRNWKEENFINFSAIDQIIT